MPSSTPPPAFIPSLAYKDNRAALAWLEAAFGFEPSQVLTDSAGNIVHAEMTHPAGDGKLRFAAVCQETRVSIEHRAWDTIPQRHAA
jgi:uncharacterized glyoxalase superfamily protein PhnB